MKKKEVKKDLDDFKNHFLPNSTCIFGGGGRKDGDIDRDKVGRPPPSGH